MNPSFGALLPGAWAVFGEHDEATLAQLLDIASRADRVALMADGHVGYLMPIGGVAAYRNKVSVAGVGFDIGCGNAAIRTDLTLERACGMTAQEIDRNPQLANGSGWLRNLADEIQDVVSFGIGRKNLADDAPVDDPLFVDPAWFILPNTDAERAFRSDLMDKARQQLGTVGSGNHYVDVFVDETGYLWVGVHFGSRGLGHTIASSFMALSQGQRWGDRVKEAEALLDLDTQLGADYWALMNLAGRYAYSGREWVARKVVGLLGAQEVELVHNHHNFAWPEQHHLDGVLTDLIVVRKGATPAWPGQLGFIGGSMGDDAVIVRGLDQGLSSEVTPQMLAMFSTVHGAGRVMSRTDAAGVRHRKGPQRGQLKLGPDGQPKRLGKVSSEAMNQWLHQKGVVLRGGGLEEAPQAYRRLPAVLKAQGDTIEVLHTLRPLVVVMAAANEHDPFKD